jgi:DnaJ-class molecular chaperone
MNEQEKNYYKILEVHRNADKQTIKQAYKELALQWHPDKHSGEEAKEAAERRFQLIAEVSMVAIRHAS